MPMILINIIQHATCLSEPKLEDYQISKFSSNLKYLEFVTILVILKFRSDGERSIICKF